MKKQNKPEKKKVLKNIFWVGVLLYFIYLIYAYLFHIPSGVQIGRNFFSYLLTMARILPWAFILIGLFEVWVPREKVEKHLGQQGGFRGYIWAIVLAGTMAGGLLVALPVYSALYHKGARISVIFTFLGASAVVRIPMTFFEVSFLGAKFTSIRWLASVPLIVISSLLLERYLLKEEFKIK